MIMRPRINWLRPEGWPQMENNMAKKEESMTLSSTSTPAYTSSIVTIAATDEQREIIESLLRELDLGCSIMAQAFPDGIRLKILSPLQSERVCTAINGAGRKTRFISTAEEANQRAATEF